MWCDVVWCGVVWCGVVWRGVAWCGVVWRGVVWSFEVNFCLISNGVIINTSASRINLVSLPHARTHTHMHTYTQVYMYVYEEMVEGQKLSEIINNTHVNIKHLPGYQLPDNVVARVVWLLGGCGC